MSLMHPTLEKACIGENCVIAAIGDPETAMLALRLGVSEGEQVTVISRIPGGPVVLRQGSRELALGRSICQHIQIIPQSQQVHSIEDTDSFRRPVTKTVSCFQ